MLIEKTISCRICFHFTVSSELVLFNLDRDSIRLNKNNLIIFLELAVKLSTAKYWNQSKVPAIRERLPLILALAESFPLDWPTRILY